MRRARTSRARPPAEHPSQTRHRQPGGVYLVPMEWSALASTVIGGMIATAAGLLAEGRRWKREHGNRRAELQRTLYGSYLASLSQVRHRPVQGRFPMRLPNQGRAVVAGGSCHHR